MKLVCGFVESATTNKSIAPLLSNLSENPRLGVALVSGLFPMMVLSFLCNSSLEVFLEFVFSIGCYKHQHTVTTAHLLSHHRSAYVFLLLSKCCVDVVCAYVGGLICSNLSENHSKNDNESRSVPSAQREYFAVYSHSSVSNSLFWLCVVLLEFFTFWSGKHDATFLFVASRLIFSAIGLYLGWYDSCDLEQISLLTQFSSRPKLK